MLFVRNCLRPTRKASSLCACVFPSKATSAREREAHTRSSRESAPPTPVSMWHNPHECSEWPSMQPQKYGCGYLGCFESVVSFQRIIDVKAGGPQAWKAGRRVEGGHEKHPLKERWTRNIITERVSGTRNTRRPNVRKGKARPPLVHAQVCDFFHFVARFAKGSVTRVQNTILSDVLLIIEPLSLTYTK